MPLSEEQRAALEAEANKRGVDAAKLIAAAERARADDTKAGSDAARSPGSGEGDEEAPSGELRPLYQYHLPFVSVNEVRTIWLGLKPQAGGEENAAKYAARMLAEATKPDAP